MTMDELRTQSGDVDFHRARRMFCIRNSKVVVAPEGTAMSHLEWFEAEGWITEDNSRAFMDSTIRGVFLPARHALFFYKGAGFFFDAAVVKEASRWAEAIMSALALDQHVEVYVGPPDAVIHGTQYRQKRLGTIESVTTGRRTMQSANVRRRRSRGGDVNCHSGFSSPSVSRFSVPCAIEKRGAAALMKRRFSEPRGSAWPSPYWLRLLWCLSLQAA